MMPMINPYESPREICEIAPRRAFNPQVILAVSYFGVIPLTLVVLIVAVVGAMLIEQSLIFRVILGCSLVVLSAISSFWTACAPDVAKCIRLRSEFP